ncbi:MAG: alpha/beta hydrolase [Syntrophorhabdaceae bacterium]|nr:alpha/beta hydrolase [Syntrophorhabdaceae bacterium]
MIHYASEDKTWIILIHGLGVSERVWFDPLEEKVLFVSFRTLLKDTKEVIPFAERLKGSYNIASWTQGDSSTIEEAAGELKKIILSLPSINSYIIIAHSRGGLVARRAIQLHGLVPRALICLSTPHYGSRFADIVMRYSGLIRLVVPPIKRFLVPIEELCTYSQLIKTVNRDDNTSLERGIPHFDIYGNTVDYLKKGPLKIMGSIEAIFGKKTIDEWRQGLGDGFVAVSSSISPITPQGNSSCLPVNHLNILIDNGVWDIVNSILTKF